MQISDRIDTDCNGFVLDASALKLRSLELSRLVFPYTGPLPDKLRGSVGVCVSMDVWLLSGARCALRGIDAGGHEFCLDLSAEPAELMELLDCYWYRTKDAADGLSEPYRGVLSARYDDWRTVTTSPFYLLDMIRRLPESIQRRILKVLSSRLFTTQN